MITIFRENYLRATSKLTALFLTAALSAGLAILALAVTAQAETSSSEINTRIQGAQTEIEKMRTDIAGLDIRINDSRKVQEMNRNELAEATSRVREAEDRYNQTLEQYEGRLTAMYKLGTSSFYAIVLSSEDLSDAMGRMEYLSSISENDKRLVQKVKAESQVVNELHDKIDVLKQSNTEEIKSMVEQKQNLQNGIEALQSGISKDTAELARTQALERDEETRRLAQEAEASFNGSGDSLLMSAPPAGLRPTGAVLTGTSSWYGPGFQGNRTANGEIYNMYGMTAAHKSLPFGTWLKVTYNGRSVFVRINDRGPYVGARILDLSKASAESIGLTGVGYVTAEIYR
ncbi:MAG: septal ring lytic transglycosylase RlpA family protein [Thermoleophilia bacterium]